MQQIAGLFVDISNSNLEADRTTEPKLRRRLSLMMRKMLPAVTKKVSRMFERKRCSLSDNSW
jgi:hypothetical protein